MPTTAKKPKNKMGRPPLGVDAVLVVRLSPEMLAEIEDWAKAKKVNLSVAAREILALGLKQK